MKKFVVLFAAVLILAGAAGGWWWVSSRRDPLAQARGYLAQGDVQAAAVALRAAVRANPDNADAHLQLAALQLRTGDALAAEREARSARQLRPADPRAVLLLAQAYAAEGRWKELLAEFPLSVLPGAGTPTPAPGSPQAGDRATLLALRAGADLALDDPATAATEAAEAGALAPTSSEPPLLLARIAAVRSDWAEAGTQVDRALALDPKRVDALLLKSRLQQRAGDRPGALAALDAAVAAAPGNSSVLTERALLLLTTGDDAKARADIDAAMKSNPRDLGPVYVDAVLLTRAGKYAAADPQYTKVNASIARLPRGYFFLAVNKLALDQPEQALDAATRFHAREPGDLPGTKLLAQALLLNRQPARAVSVLNDALNAGQNDADLQDMLGRAYAASGQPAAAEQRFAAASALAPANTGVLSRLAATRMAMGNAAGAGAALERSLEVAPDQAGTAQSLVAADIAAGKTDEAAAALAQLKARTGDTEVTGNLQGLLDVARGNPDRALAQFAATAARFPNSTISRLNQARLLFTLGRPAEGEPLLASVASQEPANMQAVGPLIARYVQTGRSDAAIALVRSAIASQPGNPALSAALSDLLVNAGKPKDAVAVTDDAARGQGQLPPVLLAARARALGADNQTAAARASYDQILRVNPNDAEARRQLTDLLFNAGDYAGADAVVRDGLRLAPGNPAMLETLLRIAFKAGGLDGANRVADQLRADPANLPVAAALRGDALQLAGRQADAVATYKAAFAQAPSALLVQRIAATDAAIGRMDDASTVLRGWLKDHRDDLAATRLLAMFDLTGNRVQDATAGFEAVLKARPKDVVSLNNLAWIYQQKNDPRAKALALTAYAEQPGPDTADTLGWIEVGMGDAAAGLPLLRQSDALRPNTPTVRYHLAVALGAVGQKAEAVALLDPIVTGTAAFPEKADAKKLLDQLRG